MLNEWNKYSECVPEFDGEYLVYLRFDGYDLAKYDADLGGWLEYADDEVMYWMDLPTIPYEDEEEIM